jgi:murein DD-endopeptidase MepM/ murein hydrolase activator NlpD
MRLFLPLLAVAAALLLGQTSHATGTSKVPRGYAAAERAVQQQGRAAVELLRAGDADALHARFGPALAAEVPLAELRALIAETLAADPVGARVGERSLPTSPGPRLYAADHRWGGERLGIELALDAAGTIMSLRFGGRERLGPDPGAARGAVVRFPLTGRWWVFWGGRSELRNYHVIAPEQRHAIDLVRWERGGTAPTGGARNRDYLAWGERILAPAAGRVVAARDGVRDNRPQVEVANEDDPAGNHVLLALGKRRFALLGHMRKGSVRVRRGDRVRAGQLLGRVGNSGNTSEPHLHFHLQDSPRLGRGAGLPVRFRDVRVDGQLRRVAPALQGSFMRRR